LLGGLAELTVKPLAYAASIYGNQGLGQQHMLRYPKTYQIKVQGQLDESWSDWFDNMTITVTLVDQDQPITTLTGIVVDQAALQSILRRLHDLNLALVAVTQVDTNAEDETKGR